MEFWAQRLHDFLKPLGPDGFIGHEELLAKAARIPPQVIPKLLGYVRSPDFIEKYHWTIPYVIRGAYSNKYIVFDAEYPNRREVSLAHGVRSRETVHQLARTLAMVGLVKSTLSPTSSAYKAWSMFELGSSTALAALDILGETDGEV